MDPIAEQTPVSQPVASQSIPPTKLTQSKGISLFSKILITLFAIIIVLGIGGGGYYFGTKKSSPSLAHEANNVPTTQPSPTLTQVQIKESTVEDTNVPGQKRYTSYKLGIRFLFKADNGSAGQVAVKEVGDTVYVYPTIEDYTKGQFVKVYQKNSQETLAQAIKKQILPNVTDKCYVKAPSARVTTSYPTTYQTASIWYKNTDGTDAAFSPGDAPMLKEVEANCNIDFMPIGGLVFFLEDTKHPNKFVFFSIGQYGINADDTGLKSWQDTIEFL